MTAPSSRTGATDREVRELWADMPDHDIPIGEEVRLRGATGPEVETCPSGCGCRYGTDDADRLNCPCERPCCSAAALLAEQPGGGR